MPLTLSSLKLFLDDLFTKRHKDLLASKAGKFYEPKLAAKRSAIDALPPVLAGGVPLAKELDEMDARHDGFGGCIFYATESVLRLPDAKAEAVADARAVRAAFIPKLKELNDNYDLEAERAHERRPQLKTLKKALERFEVAGVSLLTVATKFIEAGEALAALKSDRADEIPAGTRAGAGPLRGSTIGLVSRFRRELQEEIAESHALPPDLEKRVFAYHDILDRAPAPSADASGSPTPPPAPPPASPATP